MLVVDTDQVTLTTNDSKRLRRLRDIMTNKVLRVATNRTTEGTCINVATEVVDVIEHSEMVNGQEAIPHIVEHATRHREWRKDRVREHDHCEG